MKEYDFFSRFIPNTPSDLVPGTNLYILFMGWSGQIVDQYSDEGLDRANISFVDEWGNVIVNIQADNQGYFAWNPSSYPRNLLALVVTRVGYQRIQMNLDEDFWNGMHIKMQRSGDLKEVVVTAKEKKAMNVPWGWVALCVLGFFAVRDLAKWPK